MQMLATTAGHFNVPAKSVRAKLALCHVASRSQWRAIAALELFC